MLHVNRREGLTIAVSENKYITQIAKRTILSDDALSVLVPVLEDVCRLGIVKDPSPLRIARLRPPGMGKSPHRFADNLEANSPYCMHPAVVTALE